MQSIVSSATSNTTLNATEQPSQSIGLVHPGKREAGEKINRFEMLPPLSLYIHMPWCIKKCPYCDFNSHKLGQSLPEEEYIDALIRDFALDAPYASGRQIESIFIGGGTPSLFSADALARLLSHLNEIVAFAPDCEVTMEANPGAVELGDLSGYMRAGINRLSFGVQSFDPRHLTTLGRIHSSDEARQAILNAQLAGFESINIDLMFGLPGQGGRSALDDLSKAIELGPKHISWYELTIERNTEFYRRPPRLPQEDVVCDMWESGVAHLEQAGFKQYEVSAYSKDGFQCKHNLNYWLFGDYIGIGAGAHGKITHPDGRIIRTKKTRLPKDYFASVAASRLGLESELSSREIPLEFMMNALRLVEGFEPALYELRTGLNVSTVMKGVELAKHQGLMQQDVRRISCTRAGHAHLNQVLGCFF